MIKKVLLAFLLVTSACLSVAAEKYELYIGEVKILKLGNIERIAVGKPDVISNSLLNNGQLILIAEAEGSTNIHVWFSNGTEKDYMFHVTSKPENLIKRKNDVEKMLADVDGLEVGIVGDRIVLSGQVAFGHEETIKTVQEAYEEVLVSINFAINDLVRKQLEIEDLLSDVDGLHVRIVGQHIVLSGLVDNGHAEAIDTVKGAFEEVMDLTQRGSLDMDMPDNKMVLMNIKITEFSKNYLDTLGIQWDTTVAGPAAAVAFSAESNAVFAAAEQPATSFTGLAPEVGRSALGYFGIVSEITSRINFAVNSGDALILAEPRLAARSGGEATFLSGGEFPIEISNINGTTVEFKEFGIQLSVKPEIDRNDNIRANVSTELSSINNAVAVNGIPGLNTRKTEADVLLRTGETLVMSGLLSQEASKDINGIKFLKDIPILGKLFSSETFRDNKSELVIFVTPKVFDSSSELNRETAEYINEKTKNVIEAIDEDSLDIVY